MPNRATTGSFGSIISCNGRDIVRAEPLNARVVQARVGDSAAPSQLARKGPCPLRTTTTSPGRPEASPRRSLVQFTRGHRCPT
jgi:hypothetical protein